MLKCLIRYAVLLVLYIPASHAGHSLTVPGTGEGQMLLQGLVDLYTTQHPGQEIHIPDSTGSGGGIQAVISNDAILGRTARPLKASETAEGVQQVKYATVPVVFVVHPSVTGVDNLSVSQLKAIYGGDISNWQDVGGPDHKIYIVNREQGDSNRDVLESSYPDLATFEPVGIYTYSNGDTLKTLSDNAYTIGYTSLASVLASSLKSLSIDQVAPTDPNYPAAIPFT
ncbi:substrate-binding domain-containing protein [Aliamphritea spongicola]|nr:substrate-binding domain-containing protein [Aliamphritea spongicola]